MPPSPCVETYAHFLLDSPSGQLKNLMFWSNLLRSCRSTKFMGLAVDDSSHIPKSGDEDRELIICRCLLSDIVCYPTIRLIFFDDNCSIQTAGLYQHVYVDSQYLCVGVCWYKPWEATCERSAKYAGNKYCKALNCEHDKGTDDNDGNRFAGCHRDDDGGRKIPFHRCNLLMCYIINRN